MIASHCSIRKISFSIEIITYNSISSTLNPECFSARCNFNCSIINAEELTYETTYRGNMLPLLPLTLIAGFTNDKKEVRHFHY